MKHIYFFSLLAFLLVSLKVKAQQTPPSYLNKPVFTDMEEQAAAKRSSAIKHRKLAAIQDETGSVPPTDYVSVYKGQWFSEIVKAVSDVEGNIYAAGEFSDTLKFEGHSYTDKSRRSIFLAKFSSEGNLIWLKKVTNRLIGFPLAHVNDLEINGTNLFLSSSLSGGSVNIESKPLPDGTSSFISAYTTNGDLSWVVPTASSSGLDELVVNEGSIFQAGEGVIYEYDYSAGLKNEIYLDKAAIITQINLLDHNLIISGYIEGNALFGNTVLYKTGTYLNAFIASYDLTSASFSWATANNQQQTEGSAPNSTRISSVDVNESHIYITFQSYFASPLSWGNVSLSSSKGAFAAKFTAEGTPLWISEIPDNNSTHGTSFYKGAVANSNFVAYSNPDKELYWFDLDGQLHKQASLSAHVNDITYTGNQLTFSGSDDYKFLLKQTDPTLSTPNWQIADEQTGGFNEWDGLEIDTEGNLYHLGSIGGKTHIFNKESSGSGLVVAKTDAEGNSIWTLLFENAANFSYGKNIKADSRNGAIYVTGYSTQTFSLQGITYEPQESLSGFVAKISTEGKLEWIQHLPKESSGLGTDSQGNVYVSGVYDGDFQLGTVSPGEGVEHHGGFLVKLKPTGEPVWGQFFSGDDIVFGTYIAIDEQDNLYFTGEFYSRNIILGNGETLALGEEEGLILLVRLNTEGSLLWTRVLGGGSDYWLTWPTNIETTPQGNVILNGWSASAAAFGEVNLSSPYNRNHFVASISPEGNTQWAKIIKTSKWGYNYNEMDVDKAGNVYVGGQFAESVEFEEEMTLAAGDRAMYVAKYNADGSFAYAKSIETADRNLLGGFAVSSPDNLFINGSFRTAQFDETEYLASDFSGFLLKLGTANPNGLKEELPFFVSSLNLYPNPASEQLKMEFSRSLEQQLFISLYNMQGKKLNSYTIEAGEKYFTFPVFMLEKGIYLLQFTTSEESSVRQFIKN
jgi:hypothetical protein